MTPISPQGRCCRRHGICKAPANTRTVQLATPTAQRRPSLRRAEGHQLTTRGCSHQNRQWSSFPRQRWHRRVNTGSPIHNHQNVDLEATRAPLPPHSPLPSVTLHSNPPPCSLPTNSQGCPLTTEKPRSWNYPHNCRSMSHPPRPVHALQDHILV